MSRPGSRIAYLALAATVQLAASTVAAQGTVPRACVSSAAASLVPTTRFTPVSAVMTAPDTLWVLYSDHDARNIDAVSLLEVHHVGHAQNVEVRSHEVGEGFVTQRSLAIVGDHVVGAWVRPDRHVGVFSFPVHGGSMQQIALDAPRVPGTVSVARVGNDAIVTWDDNGRGLRHARVNASGALVGGVTTLRGRYASPAASSAFDGTIALQNGTGAGAHIALLPNGARRPVGARGAVRIGGVAFPSAAASNDHAYVLFTARGNAHLTLVDSPAGAGRDRVLGPASPGSETALAGMDWGTYAAWTHNGSVQVVPVGADGAPVSPSFEVTDPASPERARTPAIAASSQMAAVVWWGAPDRRPARSAGTVRFVRLDCH
jgi:hypothetical protein